MQQPLSMMFDDDDDVEPQILRRLMEDTTREMKEPRIRCDKAQFSVSVKSSSSSKDVDDKNDCDYSSIDDDSDEFIYSESSIEDDYSSSENNINVDESTDGDTDNDDSDNDDCTDAICAICDDGGKLLRGLAFFYARTANIRNTNASNVVFKCNNASCGHFYHPKCVAKLLEPDDGACELAQRIMSGMSFTCPVHWCFKCGKMEDRTQRALQFADPRLTVINPEHAAKCFKEDLQFEPSVVGSDASPGSLETAKGLEKQFGTSPFAKSSRIQNNSSCAVGVQLKNRVMSKADKETPSGISHDTARKRVTSSTLGIHGCTDQDILSAKSPVEKDAGWVRIAVDKDDGSLSRYFHENHEQNCVLGNPSLEKHAEEEGGELKSGKEGGMEQGYNAHEHDLVLGQEKDISICEKDTGSENGKAACNGSNKCGSGSEKVTPVPIDDHPPQKPLNVANVDKLSIINRTDTDTQPKYGRTEAREVNGSYDCQADGNSSQSNKNPRTTDIDNACDKLIKRKETKEKATDSNKGDLNKNRKYSHRKNGNEDPCEGTRLVHEVARVKNQRLADHKELDAPDCMLKDLGIDSPWYNGENAAADISKPKSKKRTVPNGRDEIMCIRPNSLNLPVGRNARNRLRNYSPGQDMYHRDSYPKTSNRPRYEPKRHVNYSCHDYGNERQWNSWEPVFSPDFCAGQRRSPPPYLGRQEHGIARRWARPGPEYIPSRRHNSPSRHGTLEDIKYTTDWDNFHDLEYDEYIHSRSPVSPTYNRRPEYGRNRKETPPFHPRNPDIHRHRRMPGYGRSPGIHPHRRTVKYGTSRKYSTSHSPRRSEDVGYTLDWNTPPRLHYDRYNEYGGYSDMDIDPIARYSSGDNDDACRPGMDVNMEERVAMHGGSVSDYGEGSLIPKASGSVTDKYAPRLDQINHLLMGRSRPHYDLPPVQWC
ncbi:hypothetical protein PR202_gb03387 [Eleusine coracana subsp. coracana]|uniref:Histone-lysine N-methyltransferase NSD-like PHD zinc finger domain-containing protein n=1 Tax=Eleusine coracana subsp. coracana TaxID=191504 RepID=A0AAV5E113_ELECO|nr:hypothetical protein PR202_gb03387 [Eleusine coracana subsp. coracana]